MPGRETRPFDWNLWLQWVMASTLGWAVGMSLLGEAGIGPAIGVLQWLVLRQHTQHTARWVWVTGGGWLAAWLVAVTLIPPEFSLLAGAWMGAALGLGQWFVLRGWFRQAGWWLPISSLGWALGLAGLVGTLLGGAVVGAVTGIALELLVRYASLESKAQGNKL